ncbi:MAG: DNA polymerase IV [Planctomycetes bacterium]|nr:DNA polymerase IV [Planctomycetota bacterium]
MNAAPQRRILHVDMDAFYASVEQRDNPLLRGKPVIVGGTAAERGVVCTASYEARRYGVKSAMATGEALRLCPSAVLVRPDFARYSAASEQLHDIFRRVTELIEPLSLDEAYLDVSACVNAERSATLIAREIRAAVQSELRLTASAGVAPNKFLAKVASGMNKPDGLTVIRPEQAEKFARALPVRKVPGIGPRTEEVCLRYGVKLCGDFLRYTEAELTRWFGSQGPTFLLLARGIDERPVECGRERTSLGIEETFARDLEGLAACVQALGPLADGLWARLTDAGVRGRCLTLKVKYHDFTRCSRSRLLVEPPSGAAEIVSIAVPLLRNTEASTRAVRLLGLQLSKLEDPAAPQQLPLPFAGSNAMILSAPSPR